METYVVREALALAADLNLKHLHIASDCQGVIKDINQRTGRNHGAIIKEIISTATDFQFCIFIHESRTFNFEAHNIAKYACDLALGRHLWLGVPVDQLLVPLNIALN